MRITLATLLITSFLSIGASAMDTQNNIDTQTITKASDLPEIEGSDENFTGEVAITPLTKVTDGINATSDYVSFNASARSFWHTHPKGQYLVVTEGEGLVQEWGKAAEKIGVGDVIFCPPGIKHWHGANGKTAMTHLALTGSDEDGNNVDWLEPVSDAQYHDANH